MQTGFTTLGLTLSLVATVLVSNAQTLSVPTSDASVSASQSVAAVWPASHWKRAASPVALYRVSQLEIADMENPVPTKCYVSDACVNQGGPN